MPAKVMMECRAILMDETATRDEQFAAQTVLCGRKVDQHIASVLAGYAARQQRVNKYGK
jgi:hypothetical protein